MSKIIWYASPMIKKARTSGTGFSYWTVFAEEDLLTGQCYTYSKHFSDTVTGIGIVTTSVPTLVSIKNTGKSNSLSLIDQAILEAKSSEKRKRDSGYSETGKVARTLPVRAKVYTDRLHLIDWTGPYWLEQKMNGYRLVTDGDIFYSRNGLDLISEVVNHLRFPNPENLLWDGEILLPGNLPLNLSTPHITKHTNKSHELLFVVYDVITDEPYSVRWQRVLDFCARVNNPNILPVICHSNNELQTQVEVEAKHKEFVARGYEGSIFRWGDCPYYGALKQSDYILKLKDFITEEFLVVDVKSGKGKAEKWGILVCQLPNGNTVDVTPEGTVKKKELILKYKEKHVGKYWTVRFKEYTTSGSLEFPVGVDLRPDWDIVK